ncbi:ceramide glucosyltransferase [Sphingomonas sp. YR710]|uniref:bacteriohopanetetrol glucosamine biosynthesis glycosyltransferase HpnI n=1 Tax=Sphingomonas sp. YR710 TaxID=1882773 RepID=UPI000889EF8B|nr:bacteriohopanetetrol glucosamine biosynthesis glycosyltransferase HpnI [Sphingomonas sp. YR710]SDD77676.1 ceramide glucosyltransferase [Sphingomonas sp. YR710]
MILGSLFQLMALVGVFYTLAALVVAGRRTAMAANLRAEAASVTLLKPLYGSEPRLSANLQTFLDQDYPASIEMICGVQRSDDPAAETVRALRSLDPRVTLCIDGRRHGSNGKVANLINMTPHIGNDLVVLSDSDMAVEPDYLVRIAAALAAPGVGAATCLYAGRGDAGFWSRLAAAGISYQFLPSVMMGLALGLARPCMGSTIAMRRETLDRIGGFAPFADVLADDHAIGEAVRALGLAVVVPPMIVIHGCTETSLGAVARHELRWNATVRGLDPIGFAGSIVTYPIPLALLGLLSPTPIAAFILIAACAARVALMLRIDRLTGRNSAPSWVLPLRDIFSLILFAGSFFIRSVDWRGERLRMEQDGRVSAKSEFD